MSMVRRLLPLLICVLLICVASAAFAVGIVHIANSSADAVSDALTGLLVIAAGVVGWVSRPPSRCGRLLVMAGLTWFLGNLAGAGGVIGGIGAASTFAYRGVLIHLLLTFPTGRIRSRSVTAAVIVGYATSLVPPVWTNSFSAILVAAVMVVAVARVRAAAQFRRSRRVATWAAGLFGVALATGALVRALAPTVAFTQTAKWFFELAVVLLAALLVAELRVGGRGRQDVADAVVELGTERGMDLRDALAWALGDPTVRLRPPDPDNGMTADTRQERGMMTVRDLDGRSVAVVEHAAQSLVDPAARAAVAAAVRLEIENRRLRAEVRARAAAVRDAQVRLLQVADEEGRQLEARLQDGAAARLRRIGEHVDAAAAHCRGLATAAAQLRAVLADTDAEVSRIATGLYPRVLEEIGLEEALVRATDGLDVPVVVRVTAEAPAPELALAVYYVTLEAISNVAKHARASMASVSVSDAAGGVHVEVRDDGVGGAGLHPGGGLSGVADRVRAMGGRFQLDQDCGTVVTADLPRSGSRT